ncbi:MAG: putative DNA modification/repair radical SAM protein [Xanthomonadaceae bacterium]|nr:putative DNA modification/repair radical SAM protein [Xanthomonadaceae bacterium]
MQILDKLAILADAAKYDASCASCDASKGPAPGTRGNAPRATGVCHSYTPDGRCVSLLKVLLTNFCIYDCAYCINRISSDVRRARFAPGEVVRLTLDFYRRNYVEGLFLSSGIIRNSDYTMEQMVEVVRRLREDHQFAGYIHLKAIPSAAPELLAAAGRYADRLSVNVELSTAAGLAQLAPDKTLPVIHSTMGELRWRIEEGRQAKRAAAQQRVRPPRFAPAGQSTQMIVGADASNDHSILHASDHLYRDYQLSRVYYSAFNPIPGASPGLPPRAPPLLREHRLYQADWLLRFYQFDIAEVAPDSGDGMLDLEVDPKLAWALRHPERFPININTAPREALLRVPGLGTRNVTRILSMRRHATLRLDDLVRLRTPIKKLLPFVELPDHHPRRSLDDPARLRRQLAAPPEQPRLFD